MQRVRAPHLFTVEEYELMVERGVLTEDDRVELIEGVIVDLAALGDPHMAAVDKLTRLLTSRIGTEEAIIRIQGAIRLPPSSMPEPDVSVLDYRDDYYASKGAEPDSILLVIEVADSSVLWDRNEKIPLYGRRGIRESWLVDLPARMVEVYRGPGPEGYESVLRFGSGDTLVPLAFPGVEIGVSEILPRV